MIDIETLDFEKMGGLIPAIVQNAKNGTVLMLGYMDQEALEKTMAEKTVFFYSRSRQKLWQKGETSGHFLNLVDLRMDCDGDALLVLVEPVGPTCHLGRASCFDTSLQSGFLSELSEFIQGRKRELPKGSYTTSLFEAGLPMILQKLNEECVEVQHAARKESLERLQEETADLLYHLWVLLAFKEIPLVDVIAVLQKRHTQPGPNPKKIV